MKLCPNCGSDNIDWRLPQIWSYWVCKTCGYTGPAIEGDEKIAKEIRKDYLKKLKENDEKSDSDLHDTESDNIDEDDLTDEEIEKKLDELMSNSY